MKNSVVLLRFLLFILLVGSAGLSNGQAYYRLEDASGFNINAFQADLEAAAQALQDSFPAEFQDDFKVYDFGFYLHQEVTDGGYPEVFSQKVVAIAQMSPYYLVFGKQTDRTGIYSKFWVALKLPTTGKFSCLDLMSAGLRENIRLKIDLEINETKLTSPTDFAKMEITAMDSLKSLVSGFVSCCNLGQRSATLCTSCILDPAQIKSKLLLDGFVGVPITGISDDTEAFDIRDYAKIKVNGVNIASQLANLGNSLSGKQHKTFVTDNKGLCGSMNFDNANAEYSSDLDDYDIWIHIWRKNDSATTGILFCRFEYYFWADADNLISSYLSGATRNNNTGYYIIDPETHTACICKNNVPLPFGNSDDSNAEPPFYIVVNNGETFNSIVQLYEFEFTVSDLTRWNPGVSGTNLTAGKKLLLFLEDFKESQSSETYGLSIPLSFDMSIYQPIISRTEAKNQLTQVGLTPNQAFGLLAKPSFVTKAPIAIPPELLSGESGGAAMREILNQNSKKGWIELINPGIEPMTLARGANILVLVLTTPTTLDAPPMFNNYIEGLIYQEYNFNPSYLGISVSLEGSLKYVTYTKSNMSMITPSPLRTGRVYIGRSRGYSSPQEIVKAREKTHKVLIGEGYKVACLESFAYATKPFIQRSLDISYHYIRGRENRVIRNFGDPWGRKGAEPNKQTRSRNRIWGIEPSRLLPLPNFLVNYAEWAELLSEVNPFQPNKDWDGVCP